MTGLRLWDGEGRPLAKERPVLVAEALARIDKWVKSRKGEPVVRIMKPEVRQITHVGRHEAQMKRIQEGRHAVAVNFKASLDEDMEEIFGGKFHTRLFGHVNDGDLDGVQTEFNVSSPSDSPFHGFTITAGAGILVDAMVKDYALDNSGCSKWSFFLQKLRTYGFREDICNVGIRSTDRDFNNSTFIFYHEHFHAQGLEELKNVVRRATKMHNGQILD